MWMLRSLNFNRDSIANWCAEFVTKNDASARMLEGGAGEARILGMDEIDVC